MRKFLVVVDKTPECMNALRFAARRAAKTGGGVTMLYVIAPEEFQHWVGVAEVMRHEKREEAEARLGALADEVRALSGVMPEFAIREGVAQAVSQGAKAVFVDVTRRPHPAKLGAEFQGGACHAGRYETSLVMAATPFLVHEDLAVGLPENPTSLSEAIAAGRHSFREAGGDRAYFGAPAEASAAEGEALLSQLATIYLEAARALLAE